MVTSDITQLEMVSQVDELIERLSEWAQHPSSWEPMNSCRALVRRLIERLNPLRLRLDAPLIVATFGGTGTGKSTLVNALIGQECTTTGRQRPTTMRPVLIADPATDLDMLGFNLDEFEIVRCQAPLLREAVLIDCPDPDTSETDSPGSNLGRLHRLLPHCDVLIYTSTQQKYRSARIVEELAGAATGCRLIFVQTMADVDEDIRDDWKPRLDEHYAVPEVFFVDSLRALKEQQEGLALSGDFGRLLNLLQSQVTASERLQIRRANLVDLIYLVVERCRKNLSEEWPHVQQLHQALGEQRIRVAETMSRQLREELLVSRNLWERRLLSSVSQAWGTSPFSSMLRLYNGMGNVIASFGLMRARSSAQVALIGAFQGVRWFNSMRSERDDAARMERIATLGLDDAVLRESQVVISGYARTAGFDPGLLEQTSISTLRDQAAQIEEQFLGDASRRTDEIIDELAAKNTSLITKAVYEVLFGAFVLYVLYRVGWNFFFVSFVDESRILTIDFYVTAAVIFLLWSGLLVMSFARRLRRGLNMRVEELARDLAQSRLAHGLFPMLEQQCQEITIARQRLDAIAFTTQQLRRSAGSTPSLGAPVSAAITAGYADSPLGW